MSAHMEKVQSGDPLAIPAATFNTFVDAAQDLLRRQPLTRGVVRALPSRDMTGYVHILRCSDGRYYYGSTNDLIRRLAEHRAGQVRSTRPRLPIELVYFEECQTLDQARQTERSLKNGRTRRKKIGLMVQSFPRERLAPFA